MRLVVLGAPGAGKGTQARNLAKIFHIVHISTGDILREHMKRETPIGISIIDLMNKGQLVPDDLVINLIKERIAEEDCGNGFILDGFPRTLFQAEVFDGLSETMSVPLDHVISVDVDDEVIVERMSGRLVCPACGAMYHTIYYPSKRGERCDSCGESLIQREDDKAKTVRDRLEIYHEITEPIIAFYRKKNLVFEVSGVGDMQSITDGIVRYLTQTAH
jgi:adenylate kinase